MPGTSTPIQTGRTEQIRLDVRDGLGAPFLGATAVMIRIQRASDGGMYDWNDNTFKTSGVTTLNKVLDEADVTNLPGIYELTGGFDSSAITNIVSDDTYVVFPVKGPAANTSGAVLPGPGEMKIGWYADGVGLNAFVSTTIDSASPGTMELMAWLVRNGSPVTTGLTGASVIVYDAAGATIVAAGAMTGPTAQGIFRRSVPGVSLAIATNYLASLTVTDAQGAQLAYTAIPTVG